MYFLLKTNLINHAKYKTTREDHPTTFKLSLSPQLIYNKLIILYNKYLKIPIFIYSYFL